MSETRRAGDFLPLHPLEFRILMALFEGATFGTRIVEEIEAADRRGRKLYPANLYRRIRTLMSSGLIQPTAAPSGADPRRTYLELTPLGRDVSRAEARRLQELIDDATRRHLLPEG